LKIVLVILHADAARGGAERYTVELARALAKAGHEVALASGGLIAQTYTQAHEPGVPFSRVTLKSGGVTRARRYRRFLDSLDFYLDTTRHDIVHAMLPVRACDVYHPHAGIARAAMQRWNVHLNPRRKAMARVERELLAGKNPPLVLCLSEYLKKSVRQYYPGIDDRLATLFNAVDLNTFEPGPRPEHPDIRALFIGQDFERKGLAETIAAVRQLNDSRLKLTVVGKCPAAAPARAANVSFVGQVDDPRPYYRDADFFVLPTKHDPCSLVVLESLAMGVPVISTRFNGACEIMTDGVHGYVLDDPTDVSALAGAMRRLLDAGLRANMSASCLELRRKLSYEHHLSSLVKIYQRIIASRRLE
jgi:UDP-glucose:(heptosyl)LPS alpha-1,3-glucosyltransferase